MASLTLRSSSFAPSGAVISTVAVASAASGKVTFSWFSALVELAPGTSKVSLKLAADGQGETGEQHDHDGPADQHPAAQPVARTAEAIEER